MVSRSLGTWEKGNALYTSLSDFLVWFKMIRLCLQLPSWSMIAHDREETSNHTNPIMWGDLVREEGNILWHNAHDDCTHLTLNSTTHSWRRVTPSPHKPSRFVTIFGTQSWFFVPEISNLSIPDEPADSRPWLASTSSPSTLLIS
jgi:hypothetical protein